VEFLIPHKKKPDPYGPGFSLSARGPTSPSRGEQLPTISVAIWEDGRQFVGSNNASIGAHGESDNTAGRMPAMRGQQPEKCLSLLNKMRLSGVASCARCSAKPIPVFSGSRAVNAD
jgi:hypothetical protein